MSYPPECPYYGCGGAYIYHSCPVHGPGCTCQYGPDTPKWYGSVATCPLHADSYRPDLAPQWALDSAALDRERGAR